jgi:hypothetical protein
MRTQTPVPLPADIGFLLDELRLAGVTTYADLAATLNRQGIRPLRGRWTAHALHLAMRRHRHAHPQAALNFGAMLYARRAAEARRIIRRTQRRGFRTQERSMQGALPPPVMADPGPRVQSRASWRTCGVVVAKAALQQSPRFIDWREPVYEYLKDEPPPVRPKPESFPPLRRLPKSGATPQSHRSFFLPDPIREQLFPP